MAANSDCYGDRHMLCLLVTDEEEKLMLGICDMVHYENLKIIAGTQKIQSVRSTGVAGTLESRDWIYLFCLHWTG